MLPNNFLIHLLLQYRYFILFPAALIEGPVVTLAAGLLTRLGYFDFFLAWACIVVGENIGDVIWYWIGYHWGERFVRRFGGYVSIKESQVEQVKGLYARYHARILLISKLTNGLGFAIAILFVAGLSRVSFWRFVLYNFIGEAVWAAVLVWVGYTFGSLYIQINDTFGRVAIIALLVLAAAAIFGFGNYVRKRMTRTLE